MGVMNIAVATKNLSNGAPDLAAVKTRQQSAWSSGDYAVVGSTLQIVGETLCEALDLRAGQKVLDVAAGNGNATLAAARRWCHVVSTDYVETLLMRGRDRAEAEGWDNIDFKQADAEALPFSDASFDAVLSTYGVMFTPDHAKAASELLRLCKSGGKIDRKSTRLNSSHPSISYAVFCLKKKKNLAQATSLEDTSYLALLSSAVEAQHTHSPDVYFWSGDSGGRHEVPALVYVTRTFVLMR